MTSVQQLLQLQLFPDNYNTFFGAIEYIIKEIMLHIQTGLFHIKRYSNGRIVYQYLNEIATRVSHLQWWEFLFSIHLTTVFVWCLLSLSFLPVHFWWASDSWLSTRSMAQQSFWLLTFNCLKQWMLSALPLSAIFLEKYMKIWWRILCLMQNIWARWTWIALLL